MGGIKVYVAVWIKPEFKDSRPVEQFAKLIHKLGVPVFWRDVPSRLVSLVLYANLCTGGDIASLNFSGGQELEVCLRLLTTMPLPGQVWVDTYYSDPHHGFVPQ